MLKVKIPKDFKPIKVDPPKKEEDTSSDAQWWVYDENGNGKKYGAATSDEVLTFAKGIFEDFPLKNVERLGLRVSRGAALDICLGVAINRHRNLFGGPELWDQLESWQRIDKLTKKEDKSK